MPPLGVIAGAGDFPRDFCHALHQKNHNFIVIAFKDITDIWFEDYTFNHAPLGHMGKTLKFLHAHGVKKLVMVGKFFRPAQWSDLMPDTTGLRWLWHLRKVLHKGDDTLLTCLAQLLEQHHLSLVPPHEYWPDLRISARCQTHASITHGINVLKTLSSFDIGQSVVVQGQRILGLEAAEGSEHLIQRCAALKLLSSPKPWFIKMAKIHQSLALDPPVIGLETLKSCHDAGFEGIAFEAERTYLLQQDASFAFAKQYNLTLWGF